MEKNWEQCINFTLGEEGGLTDDTHDHGGLTNHGMSSVFYNEWRASQKGMSAVYPQKVSDISLELAKDIYHSEFWIKSGADKLPSGLDAVVFDTAVNSGVGRAKQLLTLTSKASARAMAYEYLTHRHDYLASIVQKDHSQSVFLVGWMNRVSACKKIVNILAPGVAK